jgi:Tol biopolymer transport system component
LALAGTVVVLAIVTASCEGDQLASPTPTAPPNLEATLEDIEKGIWVQVRTTQRCVETFSEPPSQLREGTLSSIAVSCLENGFVGLVVADPDETRGTKWWNLAGQGWAPEDSLGPHHLGDPPYPARPELREAGYILYVAPDDDVWLMNGDGTNKRKVYHVEQPTTGEANIPHPTWAPTGDKIAVWQFLTGIADIVSVDGRLITRVEVREFLTWSPTGDAFAAYFLPPNASGVKLGVFDLNGNVLLELSDAALASFSADGRKLAYVVPSKGGLGTEAQARGMVADIETGEIDPLDPGPGYFKSPPIWSPVKNELAYGTRLIDFDNGEEKALPGSVSAWSPDGRFLLLGLGDIYDVSAAEKTYSFELPQGGTDAAPWAIVRGRFAWSPDSRYFVHTGGGVFDEPPGPIILEVYDSPSGSTYTIPATPAVELEFSPQGHHIAFTGSTGGPSMSRKDLAGPWIYIVDADGSGLTLLAQGLGPTWQPR